MEAPQENAQGLFRSLGRLLSRLVSIADNRLELLLVEVQEERWRLFEALLLAGAVAALGLTTLLVVTFTLVVVFWDEHRLVVLAGLSLLYLLGTLVAWRKLKARVKNWLPFPATLAELQKDRACLDKEN